jgi:DNA-binding GntR family transcriptional regulator
MKSGGGLFAHLLMKGSMSSRRKHFKLQGVHSIDRPKSSKSFPRAVQSQQANAYEEIKRRIIRCEFRPGEYLNEAYISTMIGAGRTPVHQAISRLMLEGMVEIIPRKGVIVKPISLDEVLQIIEVRLMLELNCARFAAERADQDDISTLRSLLASAQNATRVPNTEKMMLIDREFHLALARTARAPVLADILRNLHERSLRFWFISLNQPHHHVAVQKQHSDIVEAIEARDPDAAERAMRVHIEATRQNIVRSL